MLRLAARAGKARTTSCSRSRARSQHPFKPNSESLSLPRKRPPSHSTPRLLDALGAPRPRREDDSLRHLQSTPKTSTHANRSDSQAPRVNSGGPFRTVHSDILRSLPESGAEPPFVRQSNPRVRQLLTQSPKLSPFARARSKAGLVAEHALETTFSAGSEASSAGRFLPRPKFALGASDLCFFSRPRAGARLFSSSGRQRGRLKQPKAFP